MGRKKIFIEGSKRVAVRVFITQRSAIQNLVDQGKYKDLSDFVRKAIDDKLGLEWIK